jgi:hypothetical protein
MHYGNKKDKKRAAIAKQQYTNRRGVPKKKHEATLYKGKERSKKVTVLEEPDRTRTTTTHFKGGKRVAVDVRIRDKKTGEVRTYHVKIDEKGNPRFEPFIYTYKGKDGKERKADFPVTATRDRKADFAEADKLLGIPRPDDYTWHHVEGGKRIILVPTEVHSAVGHHGGVSQVNE